MKNRIREYLAAIDRGKVPEYHNYQDYQKGIITRNEYFKRKQKLKMHPE